MFRKYMHVIRATDPLPASVKGAGHGLLAVFPKLDGANHCAWYDFDERKACCASRNVVLTEDNDSTGFYRYWAGHAEIADMCLRYKGLVFYGEYLTPHSVKDYHDDAWGKWYVFDVYSTVEERYMTVSEYEPLVSEYGIEVIPPMAFLNSPSRQDLIDLMESNHYLLDPDRTGEGIVIKNYAYRDAFGRQVWLKMVTEDFHELFKATYGYKMAKPMTDEQKFVVASLTEQFVSKELAKFTTDEGREWNDRMFPDFIKVLSREWESDYGPEIMCFLSNHPDASAKKVRKDFNQRAVKLVKSLT